VLDHSSVIGRSGVEQERLGVFKTAPSDFAGVFQVEVRVDL
jgi:hypothetical protein